MNRGPPRNPDGPLSPFRVLQGSTCAHQKLFKKLKGITVFASLLDIRPNPKQQRSPPSSNKNTQKAIETMPRHHGSPGRANTTSGNGWRAPSWGQSRIRCWGSLGGLRGVLGDLGMSQGVVGELRGSLLGALGKRFCFILQVTYLKKIMFNHSESGLSTCRDSEDF